MAGRSTLAECAHRSAAWSSDARAPVHTPLFTHSPSYAHPRPRTRQQPHLATLPSMQELTLRGNPLCDTSGYRAAVAKLLPALATLDDDEVRGGGEATFEAGGEAGGRELRFVTEAIKKAEVQPRPHPRHPHPTLTPDPHTRTHSSMHAPLAHSRHLRSAAQPSPSPRHRPRPRPRLRSGPLHLRE